MQKNISKFLILSSGLLIISGCVSSSKHKEAVEALQTQVDQEKSTNSKISSENQILKTEKNQLEEKLISTTKDRGQLKASLEDMKKAMEEMSRRQAEQKKRLQEFEELTRRFKKLADSGAISVKIIEGKMVVSMGSDVLFPSGSAKLSTAGRDAVREVTAQLILMSDKRYQIEGHTDNVPISTAVFPSNWELASARSINVVKAMIESGMPVSRVSAASFGDTQPILANDTTEGKAANRRIAIVVVPDLSTMPGYDELNKVGAGN